MRGQTDLSVNRRQRRVIGASTLISRKKGRKSRRSNAASSGISVVTQSSRHLGVTKSISSSMVSKDWADGFGELVRESCSNCSSTTV